MQQLLLPFPRLPYVILNGAVTVLREAVLKFFIDGDSLTGSVQSLQCEALE